MVEKKERRGRKKKNKEVEVKVKKKRGRKASSQFYSSIIRKKLPNLLDDTVEEKQIEDDKNVILHLDIVKDSNKEETTWTEYDDTTDNQLTLDHNKSEKTTKESRHENVISVLKDFDKNKSWPEKTNIKCWWCCHNFDDTPVGVPIKIYDNIFYLKGCFCSFNCCLSYVNDNKNMYKYDSIYPLIKSLRAKLTKKHLNDPLTPAPPRECLDIFGGELSIEEFRSINDDYIFKRVNYPMKIIIEQIEKLNIKPTVNKIVIKEPQNEINEDLINQAQIRISKNKEMKTVSNTLDKFLLNF